ncbi:unnamed protein product [Caenorhabditis nigoni]
MDICKTHKAFIGETFCTLHQLRDVVGDVGCCQCASVNLLTGNATTVSKLEQATPSSSNNGLNTMCFTKKVHEKNRQETDQDDAWRADKIRSQKLDEVENSLVHVVCDSDVKDSRHNDMEIKEFLDDYEVQAVSLREDLMILSAMNFSCRKSLFLVPDGCGTPGGGRRCSG